MVRRKYTEEQIIAVLKEGEAGASVAELCRKHGMSERELLQLEGKIRRPHRQRTQETKGTGRGKPAPEADCRRAGAG